LGKTEPESSDSTCLYSIIRNDAFSEELLLEMQGLKAFLRQKAITLDTQKGDREQDDMMDVLTRGNDLDLIIQKLKKARIMKVSNVQSYAGQTDR
jgi:hypothetical protein